MEGMVDGKCRRCGNVVSEGGVRGEGAGLQPVLCAGCLAAIYPEGKDMPVAMDKDGNLYFMDTPRNSMIIFFGYGEVPYSSCTEVDLKEEEWGCGFSFC